MTWYEIRPGDCLASVCGQAGLPVARVWDHPQNQQLRAHRAPAVLYPGDLVFLPPLEERSESRSTEQRHRAVVRAASVTFTLRLQVNGEPRRNAGYRLSIDDGTPLSGTTNSTGAIEIAIPANARVGRLELGAECHDLYFGHLDPVGSIEGIQARLAALGFFGGTTSGEWSLALSEAVVRFQRHHHLPATGLPDAKTKRALVDAFGS